MKDILAFCIGLLMAGAAVTLFGMAGAKMDRARIAEMERVEAVDARLEALEKEVSKLRRRLK